MLSSSCDEGCNFHFKRAFVVILKVGLMVKGLGQCRVGVRT